MLRGRECLGKAHFGKTYHIRQIADKSDSCDFFVCPFPHNFFGSIDPNTDKIYIQNIRIKLARRNVFFSDRIAM